MDRFGSVASGPGGNDAMILNLDANMNVLWAKRGAPYGDRATASRSSCKYNILLPAIVAR